MNPIRIPQTQRTINEKNNRYMKKTKRSDIPEFSEAGLSRVAPCNLVYTPEEYATICTGYLAKNEYEPINIFEEGGELYFVDRSRGQLESKAAFERRGVNWVLTRIAMEDDDATRMAFPGDINAAWMPWMLIEDKLLRRFPHDEWQAYMEDFRVTPEIDDHTVSMTTYERPFIFACRTFFKKHARTE